MAPPPNSTSLASSVGELAVNIRSARSLDDLCSLLPSLYSHNIRPILKKAFTVTNKSIRVRSYLSKLDEHKTKGTFPPEIAGPLALPKIQFSEEFRDTAGYRQRMSESEAVILEARTKTLELAISLKKSELTFLEELFTSDAYVQEIVQSSTRAIINLCGTAPEDDSILDEKCIPAFMLSDFRIMLLCGKLFLARARDIAHLIRYDASRWGDGNSCMRQMHQRRRVRKQNQRRAGAHK
ncbi:hypothetical protein CcaCcLH18_13317 [Colletotrichum camelliae]|nr:hypothetical protein CcaCcLH18_13317 [Colletotrichum camelliae]